MSNIIFVMHDSYPTFYSTYTDYFKLALLSGFAVKRAAEMDIANPDHCYIVSWFDVQQGGWAGAKARIILWNLEWATRVHPLDNVGYITKDNPIPGVSEVWSPDAGFAAKQGWKYVPVASHPDLVFRHEDAPKTYMWDVTLQMYRDPHRRQRVINELRQRNIRIAPDGWQESRHLGMVNARMQVHIHQHDGMNVVSPLRFAVAAAYRKPIVSELIETPGIFTQRLIQSTYANISTTVQRWLQPQHARELRDVGERLYQTLCIDNTFERIIKANV